MSFKRTFLHAFVNLHKDQLLESKEELLEGAENGRYKVVAKAEPYKNLPVSALL